VAIKKRDACAARDLDRITKINIYKLQLNPPPTACQTTLRYVDIISIN